ncbi:SPW repeat domain-containing protein [Nonomuraea sp. SYSU D8015]|uniref:SPW repeat domain-containing protein n=1 Tax=Nonomuraea sp. SYSU D8015 TaxID=2593644 RepID=UPI00166053D4|nr:SPW repeat protein [Nonomuraea sp. SYSU D8015]
MIALFLAALVGIELMASPALLDSPEPVSDSFRTAGPLIATISFLSAFSILRGLRWLNLLCSAWLVIAPLIIQHATPALVNSTVAGAVVAVLTAVAGEGNARQRYGGGWRSLVR